MQISEALIVKMPKNTTTEKGEWISEVHRSEYLHFINIYLITFELAHDQSLT